MQGAVRVEMEMTEGDDIRSEVYTELNSPYMTTFEVPRPYTMFALDCHVSLHFPVIL